ncbi:MAG: B12-binding domain-containing radical SAM protein [Coriobacteriia bacterium]|nr:B12-binding domain-containing radical SAM protein [Coriobacteriia bacterium]
MSIRPAAGTAATVPKPFAVALVGISQPGYQSLANAYLRESLRADSRLTNLAVGTLEFDTTASPWWIVYSLLSQQHSPDVVGFSVYCWNASAVYEAIRILASTRPELPIILGGPEVGPQAKALRKYFHSAGNKVVYIASGEGERVICDVIEVLQRDPSGRKLNYLPTRDAIAQLDQIPAPYNEQHRPPTDGSAYIETYRGCPHACAYCYESKGISRVRSFSWDRIAADIELVATTPGMQSFTFVDSAFNLTPERLRKLSDIMAPFAAAGIKLHTIEVDIEKVDAEQAALLARAGVVSVETGPQTTGQKAGECVQRPFDAAAYLRGVNACKDAGIAVTADLILGLPGDTVATTLESMRFVVQEADPAVMQISSLHVLPGTALWDRAKELELRFDYDPPHLVMQTADIGFKELRELEVFGNALANLQRTSL